MALQIGDIYGFGGAVLARAIIRHQPASTVDIQTYSSVQYNETQLWSLALIRAASLSRFGRIAVVWDRTRKEAKEWIDTIDVSTLPYTKTDNRGEDKVIVRSLCVRGLAGLAEEGLGSDVSFARLLRQQLRPVRHYGCDTVVLLHAIWAEQSTLKTIRKTLSNQLRILPLTDCIPEDWYTQASANTQHITTTAIEGFEADRVWRILQQKRCYT